MSPEFLVRNWPPAFLEWSTRGVRDVCYASPQFPRLLDPEAIKRRSPSASSPAPSPTSGRSPAEAMSRSSGGRLTEGNPTRGGRGLGRCLHHPPRDRRGRCGGSVTACATRNRDTDPAAAASDARGRKHRTASAGRPWRARPALRPRGLGEDRVEIVTGDE